MNELAEIRRLLERSACRRWWEMATLELFGQQQPLVVIGAVGSSADFKLERERDRMVPLAPQDSNTPRGFATQSQVQRSMVLALEFSRRKLGALKLQLLPHLSMDPKYESALTELAFQCARILQRLASQRWTVQAQLGAPCLIGSSKAMLALDRHIEESCVDSRPVMLLGTTGNEALQTAVAIHRCGSGADQAFVKVDCENTLEPPWRWIDRARGGTLFLCSPDSGTSADQEHLWRQLEQALTQTTPSPVEAHMPPHTRKAREAQAKPINNWACRLVVALKAQQQVSDAGRASPIPPYGDWGRHDWKLITLPQLSQHTEDIPMLTRAVLDYHGHGAEHRLTDALQHWCTNYRWPGNASQLEWTVARMAVLTANTQIGASDISLHAPRLLKETSTADPDDGANPPCDEDVDTQTPLRPTPTRSPEHWVRCVVEHDAQAFAHLHTGLNRALQYLCLHFHEPISSEQLADKAHVSASHLRFLFRDSLGTSFKLFLQHVRVVHAKHLLLESPPRRITDVALSVGFNDFSHFQKCFRQIVGQTPGELRRGRVLALS
ncbi:MAG: helix-turn-helix domain-containing protein [Pseudomonadota bacterium]